MIVLGINGSIALINENRFNINDDAMHDSGAVLIDDGKLICAFEEERLNRIKHTNKFPVLAIRECLRNYNITIQQVDAFAIASEEDVYDSVMAMYREMDPGFVYNSGREFIAAFLQEQFGSEIDQRRIFFVGHHMAHAASSYYVSGFTKSLILSVDGWGDNFSGGVYVADGNKITTIDRLSPHHSIGHLYLEVTRLLGFNFFDEYKVMGLAPYGDIEKYRQAFEQFYSLEADGQYKINWQHMRETTPQLPQRCPGEPMTQDHKDMAAAVQYAIEQLVFHILKHYQAVTGQRHLCMAGGVSLNCTMTGKLLYSKMFDDIFVQPASHDGGLPLGAALYVYYNTQPNTTRHTLQHVYLGSKFPGEMNEEGLLHKWQKLISFHKSDNVTEEAATLIANGAVIGWFQGSSEFGPRALGNRSILADPRPAGNKALINKKIKNREGFRPFAPSLIAERVADIFELPDSCDRYAFMTFILKVKEEYRDKLGAITHVDGTARLHTVKREINATYYDLISRFGDITGVPVLLNTSFNNNCEPIVDSPEQAINCFLTTNLDYLVIGNYIIQKLVPVSTSFVLGMHPVVPEFITIDRENGNGTTNYKIGNTYNKKKHVISPDIYELLTGGQSGRLNIRQLFATAGGLRADPAELVQEIRELWNLRVINLEP